MTPVSTTKSGGPFLTAIDHPTGSDSFMSESVIRSPAESVIRSPADFLDHMTTPHLGLQHLTPEPAYDQGMVLPIRSPGANAAMIAASEASKRGFQVVSQFDSVVYHDDGLVNLDSGRNSGGMLDAAILQSMDSIAQQAQQGHRGSSPTNIAHSASAASTRVCFQESSMQGTPSEVDSSRRESRERVASLRRKESTSVSADGQQGASHELVNIDLGDTTFHSDAEIGSLMERLSKQSAKGRRSGNLAETLASQAKGNGSLGVSATTARAAGAADIASATTRDLSTIFST